MAGMTEASGVSVESDVSSFPVIEETTTVGSTDTPTPTPEPTETPTPTPEPTATPTPVPEKLTDLSGYDPGDVISSDKIDRDNLSQYFTSRSIEEGDSVYFDATKQHGMQALNDKKAKFLAIII